MLKLRCDLNNLVLKVSEAPNMWFSLNYLFPKHKRISWNKSMRVFILQNLVTVFSMVKLSEAVVQRCSVKKVFLEISQNSQENTCVRVSFLIKLKALGLLQALHDKRKSDHKNRSLESFTRVLIGSTEKPKRSFRWSVVSVRQ